MSSYDPDDLSAAALARLRAANPVPDERLDAATRARALARLAELTGGDPAAEPDRRHRTGAGAGSSAGSGAQPRRLVLVAAATALLVAGAATLIPGLRDTATPRATAAEVLTTTADAAADHPDLADVALLGSDYQRRSDSDPTGTVLTETRVGVGGVAQVSQRTEGAPGARLAQAAEALAAGTDAEILEVQPEQLRGVVAQRFGTQPAQTAAGALTLLLTPGLTAAQEEGLYSLLAEVPGTEVSATEDSEGEDATATLAFPGGLVATVYPATGQLAQVTGLVGEGITTRIDAAAILDCVSVAGLGGPEFVSLACADNNYVLADLDWRHWGAPEATATGTAWVNTCDPNCAESSAQPYPVTVIADKLAECGFNLQLYTELRVRYGDSALPNQPADEDFPLTCH